MQLCIHKYVIIDKFQITTTHWWARDNRRQSGSSDTKLKIVGNTKLSKIYTKPPTPHSKPVNSVHCNPIWCRAQNVRIHTDTKCSVLMFTYTGSSQFHQCCCRPHTNDSSSTNSSTTSVFGFIHNKATRSKRKCVCTR